MQPHDYVLGTCGLTLSGNRMATTSGTQVCHLDATDFIIRWPQSG